jgi:hypothetical protein
MSATWPPADGYRSSCPDSRACRRRLTRACSRQAGRTQGSARALGSVSALWNEGLCGRELDGLQLMRMSLDSGCFQSWNSDAPSAVPRCRER